MIKHPKSREERRLIKSLKDLDAKGQTNGLRRRVSTEAETTEGSDDLTPVHRGLADRLHPGTEDQESGHSGPD